MREPITILPYPPNALAPMAPAIMPELGPIQKPAKARYIRLPELRIRLGGIGRTTIYRWEKTGLFPKRRRLSNHISAWLEADVDAWIANRQEV